MSRTVQYLKWNRIHGYNTEEAFFLSLKQIVKGKAYKYDL